MRGSSPTVVGKKQQCWVISFDTKSSGCRGMSYDFSALSGSPYQKQNGGLFLCVDVYEEMMSSSIHAENRKTNLTSNGEEVEIP